MSFLAKILLLLDRIAQVIIQQGSVWLQAGSDNLPLDPKKVANSNSGNISHSGSLVLQRDTTSESGYYIVNSADLDLKLGYVIIPDSSDNTLIASAQFYSSNYNKPFGNSTDSSTATIVIKKNNDTDSVGKVLIIGDENGNPIDNSSSLYQILNGFNIAFEVSSNSVRVDGLKNGTIVDETHRVAYWSSEGWASAGELLSTLETSSKTLIGAINELNSLIIQSPTSSNIVPYQDFIIFEGVNNDGTTPGTPQIGDIIEGWITPYHWIKGYYLGGDLFNIDNYDVFLEYENLEVGIDFDAIGEGEIAQDDPFTYLGIDSDSVNVSIIIYNDINGDGSDLTTVFGYLRGNFVVYDDPVLINNRLGETLGQDSTSYNGEDLSSGFIEVQNGVLTVDFNS